MPLDAAQPGDPYEEAGAEHGVDPTLLRALTHVESGDNDHAVSPQGAQGRAQFLPGTARDMGITDTADPRQSVGGAARYLRENFDRFQGRPDLAIAAYHGGPDPGQWGPKTRAYLDKIVDTYASMKQRGGAAEHEPVIDAGSWDVPDQPKQPITIDQVRQQYPQYKDLSDDQLAQGLHRKFYSDMPFDAFAAKIGLPAAEPVGPRQGKAPTLPLAERDEGAVPATANTEDYVPRAGDPSVTGEPTPDSGFRRILDASMGGLQRGMENTDLLSPKAQEALDAAQREGGWKGKLAQFGSTLAADAGKALAIPGALFGAGQAGVAQAGAELGAPLLGRDIAAYPESLMGDAPSMVGHKEGVTPAERATINEGAAIARGSRLPTLERMAATARADEAMTPTAPEMKSRMESDALGELEPAEGVTPPGPSSGTVTQGVPESAPLPKPEPTASQVPAPEASTEPGPQPAPTRIRTIQQIQDEDGVGPKKAAATQMAEIEVVGRPITNEEREARAAGVKPVPPVEEMPVSQPTPPDSEAPGRPVTPFETVPKEPQRLINFLRDPTKTGSDIHSQVIPGGVRDPGGDIASMIGGSRGRPGLINNKTGRELDAATLHAWENGYFPEHDQRPEINDLLNKIREDHTGNPQYSMHDQDAAAEYQRAMASNSEIDRLANQHGIDTAGKTRGQFFDELSDHMSLDDETREMQPHADAHEAEYREFEKLAKQWQPNEATPRDTYGQSQARTLKDLENEHQQIEAATAREQPAPGNDQPGSPTKPQGSGPEGAEPRGDSAGAGLGDQAEGPAQDLLGRPIADKTARTPEPTIRNDPNQATMPGMERSAVQAQAARDQAGPRDGQLPADEGLFARPETPQPGLKLYAGPMAIFDPDAWKWAVGPFAKPTRAAVASMGELGKSISTGLVPMRTGTMRAQAFAATFANSLRQVMFRFGEIDHEIERNFKPDDREQMGRALDAQSVFEQQFRDLPPDQQAAAREAFDKGGTGVASLTPPQRHAIEMLDSLSQATWRRMQERGMVEPNAQAIPYYFPRQILNWSEEEGFTRPGGSGGGASSGLDGRGQNLTTAGPMRREHLTPEQTEAAAKAKLGNQATLLRDIRSLPARLAFSERAIAGVDLMKQIEQVGDQTGVNLVVRGDIPGMLHPADFFTMNDHPSFRKWTGTGWQGIHVAREFEGPLRAVLTQKSPTWYRAAANLKGGVMSAIMYSPFIHLAVELGRALPVMMMSNPVGTLTLKAVRDGSKLRRDLSFMDQATTDGLAPLGRRWAADPVSIADQANVDGRNRFVAAIANVRDAMANGAGKIGGDVLHDIVQHPHQALLWDQVFNLQVGLYNQLRDNWTKQGYAPEVAGTMAAHIANRYAGALPPEHLSRAANMASNLLLFSRSFTLGNLGVMKDMFNGAPSHIQARIQQMAGPDVAKSAQSAMRRKAISAVVMDIGLFYVANGLLQSGLQAMRQGAEPTEQDWMNKASTAIDGLSHGNLLSAFGVLPQHWNEPGKQDRVYAGTDSTGRGVYLRLPPGKVGEEFLGWAAKPGPQLMAKLSPMVRPIVESAINSDTMGKPIYAPNPQTITDGIKIAGDVVKHIAEGLGPTSTIEGLHEVWQQQVEGKKTQSDPGMSALKILGPLTGLAQISSGYPGGPAAGEIHAENERDRFAQQRAMPGVREKILNGDLEGARKDMTDAGMAFGLQRYYIQQTLNPHTTPGQQRQFNRTATPETKARVEQWQHP